MTILIVFGVLIAAVLLVIITACVLDESTREK